MFIPPQMAVTGNWHLLTLNAFPPQNGEHPITKWLFMEERIQFCGNNRWHSKTSILYMYMCISFQLGNTFWILAWILSIMPVRLTLGCTSRTSADLVDPVAGIIHFVAPVCPSVSDRSHWYHYHF